jgi:hypothetical protein
VNRKLKGKLRDFPLKDPNEKHVSTLASYHEVPHDQAFELVHELSVDLAEARFALWHYGSADAARKAVGIAKRLLTWPTHDEVI